MAANPFSLYFIIFLDICILLILFLACHVNNFHSVFLSIYHNKIFQPKLGLLSTCLKSNTLYLNTQKTFFQLFHRAKMKTNNYFNIIVDKCVLNKVTSIKYNSDTPTYFWQPFFNKHWIYQKYCRNNQFVCFIYTGYLCIHH